MHENSVSCKEIHALRMIKYTTESAIKSQLFTTPFERNIDPKNRWVRLEALLPWDKMASVYMQYLSQKSGRETVDLRTVMGAMYIQHSMNLTDRDTMAVISENIYMQYFVGLSTFQSTELFDHSLLSKFRQRLGKEGSEQLNEILLKYALDNAYVKHRKARTSSTSASKMAEAGRLKEEEDESLKKSKDDTNRDSDTATVIDTDIDTDRIKNRGTVKIDATVVPQDISYPTDTKLLNHSREISEKIIDQLYEQSRDLLKIKPRTYRREARGKWLGFSKRRKPNSKTIKKQLKAQLGYLRRNLGHIDRMIELLVVRNGRSIQLNENLRIKMYVLSEIYRQQQEMYKDQRKSISDRIVSVSQPWVRPIVRGKAGRAVEFGAKINLSLTEKMAMIDQCSYDAFNEGSAMIAQLKSYKRRFGYYPEFALADKIYLTRSNRKFMKENGIKHTGSPLGRPKAMDKNKNKNKKAKMKKKSNERNHIEGKIGQGKRKFGLDKLRTKTLASSYCAIQLIVLAMNMFSLLDKKKATLLRFNRLLTLMIASTNHFILNFYYPQKNTHPSSSLIPNSYS